MAYEGKTISVKEFRELGLLQEVNRRFLHPLGLAMEVIIDAETGEERIERCWDARDDPEGWTFGDGIIDGEKGRAIEAEERIRYEARFATLGYTIQPLPEVKYVQVKALEVGDLFAWRDAVWRLTERSITWVQARNEQFSNVQVFHESAMGDAPTWFTYVRPMP